MQLECKGCRAKILAEDVNLATRLAKCRACHAVFEFSAAPAPRADVPRPARIKAWPMGPTLILAFRWFHPALFFLAFFCVAWDSFLVFWYTMALRAPETPWLMVVFPIAHVAVGVGITYSVLAGFLNRTTITAEGGRLSVRHAPLPWRGNADVDAGSIRGFYEREKAGRRDDSRGGFQLCAEMTDGSERVLVSGLTEESEALYLAQELSRHLGIGERA